MKKIIILAALTLTVQSSWAQIREFQTSRLVSTAGAGVASILSTEAAILNPAAAAFFGGSSASYQSYKSDLQNKSELRDSESNDFPDKNLSTGAFMADHGGPVKGGIAYLLQDENNYERKRAVFHATAPVSDSTSLGLSYNYIQDTLPATSSNRHRIHHQASLGAIHIVDEDTILGLVVIDPTRATPGEERAITGFQYSIADRITLIGDVGAQYTKDVSEKYLWRGAIQLNVFSDFFLRVGQFYDNIQEFKGNGWGAGWIGPRFGVEFAQKYSEQFGSGSYIYEEEKLVDTSLSAILKF
jgi:hypothetical protein